MDTSDPAIVEALRRMPRPSTDAYFLLQALVAATKGTCPRRRAGCVLTDFAGHVIATGYNGVASGLVHCFDAPCPGANSPSGQGLHLCEALHAEENALIQCTRPQEIDTCYSVSSPCIHCLRRLMNTACRHIVFAEVYPHPECEFLWTRYKDGRPTGRTWRHVPWSQLPSFESTPAAPLAPGQSWPMKIIAPSGTDTR